jgi:hypothetical protein
VKPVPVVLTAVAVLGVVVGLAHRYTQPIPACARCGTTCRRCRPAATHPTMPEPTFRSAVGTEAG